MAGKADTTDSAGVSLRFYNTVGAILANEEVWNVGGISEWAADKVTVNSIKSKIRGDQISFKQQPFTEEEEEALHQQVFSYITTPTGQPFLTEGICKELNGEYLFISWQIF